MNYITKQIDKNSIWIIKPLWEKLNQIHLNESPYFKEHYKNFTFEKRCSKFFTIDENNIRIEVVFDDTQPVGYCIGTIEGTKGEIDSVFVDESYRNKKLGTKLIEDCVEWLQKSGCVTIGVNVAEGHESVIAFYMKFGFYPRLRYLQYRKRS